MRPSWGRHSACSDAGSKSPQEIKYAYLRVRRNEWVVHQQLCLQVLSFRHDAHKALVRLSICVQLRYMRHQGERQALHMQQPLPRHEHAPPDVAFRHMQGPPQELHLLAPVPELLPIQVAIQPAMNNSQYCLRVIRDVIL